MPQERDSDLIVLFDAGKEEPFSTSFAATYQTGTLADAVRKYRDDFSYYFPDKTKDR